MLWRCLLSLYCREKRGFGGTYSCCVVLEMGDTRSISKQPSTFDFYPGEKKRRKKTLSRVNKTGAHRPTPPCSSGMCGASEFPAGYGEEDRRRF